MKTIIYFTQLILRETGDSSSKTVTHDRFVVTTKYVYDENMHYIGKNRLCDKTLSTEQADKIWQKLSRLKTSSERTYITSYDNMSQTDTILQSIIGIQKP